MLLEKKRIGKKVYCLPLPRKPKSFTLSVIPADRYRHSVKEAQ